MCQRIDEDLRYNRQARSLRSSLTRTPGATNVVNSMKYDTPARSRSPIHDPMDLDATRPRPYAPVGSEERKTRITNRECFGCGQKGHIQKHCTLRPFEKTHILST